MSAVAIYMRAPLLFAAVIYITSLTFVAVVLLSVSQQNQAQSSQSHRETANNPNTPPPSPQGLQQGRSVKTEAADNKQAASPQETKPFLTHGEWVMGTLTLIYVGISFFGLRAIKRQADIARVAADAAYLNAQALINSERAWVMVDLVGRPGFGLTKITSSDGSVSTAASVELRVQNCGSTPAWVFEQWVRLEVANFVVASATDYPSPQFPGSREGQISRVNYEILPMVKGEAPVKWTTDISDNGWATEDNGLYVHICGVVRYRDAFGSLRETYFGYSVWNGKLERMPSEAYNKHT